MAAPLDVRSWGAVTAVGLSAARTCAAIRASISGFAESTFYHELLDPVMGARVPSRPSPQDDPPFERHVDIAATALQECVDGGQIDPARTALLLGVREAYRSHPDFDGRQQLLLRKIEEKLGKRFHSESAALLDGNAATFRGIQLARDLLTTGRVDMCIAGGVDSYLNVFDLNRFEECYRLKSEKVAQGFIPGEGAAFVAVSLSSAAKGRAALAHIIGVGLAQEDAQATVLSTGFPTGRALERAMKAAIQDALVPESAIDFRMSDLNGENYRGMESMLAMSRFYRTPRAHFEIWHPADCVGEIGAASGALLVIVAAMGMIKHYAPGVLALCETSSDAGLRAACLVRAGSPPL